MADSRKRIIVKGAVLAVVVMFVAECLRIFVGANFYAVVPGRCYRSAQPTPQFLESIKRTHGIVAILNLRGGDENGDEAWYQNEKAAAERLGLKLFPAGLSSSEQPPEEDFWKFVQALDECPEPMLIHCANGNDRTGLASAIYLMMRTDTPIAEARKQLSLRYGHFYWSKAKCLHRILDSYEEWLAREGKTHSAAHFRTWAQYEFRRQNS
jgi:protein tyrosine/serine phosphatase